MIQLASREIVHLTGKRAAAGFHDCKQGQLVISAVELELKGLCDLYDPKRLRQTGSLALRDGKILTARSLAGERVWNTAPARRPAQS